jgi:hypothetical protein
MLISLAKEIDYQCDVHAERLHTGRNDSPPLIDQLCRTGGLRILADLKVATFTGVRRI